MRPLRASAVQMLSYPEEADKNCEKIMSLSLQSIQDGASLICFPEASLTGYSADRASELALALNDSRVTELVSFSSRHKVVLSFGLIERGEDLPFITQAICFDGQLFTYRKTHLGTIEQGNFCAGNSLDTIQTPLGCIGIALCWEWSIPDIASTLRGKGAEVLLAPFASPLAGERRLKSWSTFLPARARDNGAYVIACNAVKPNPAQGGGGCVIYDPRGTLMASCCSNSDELLSCDLDGNLPRYDTNNSMSNISFYDCRRPELYS